MNDGNKSKYIIANWKMNPVSFSEADNLIRTIKKNIKKLKNTKIIICPPAVYLSKIKTNANFELGIQNIFWEDKGAYTGEISATMAKNLKVKYAIIGHSERRKYLLETDEAINLKIKAALRNKINSVLCVGETLKEKQQDKASEIVVNQIREALNNIPLQIANNKLQIAYEPVWAIGTGEMPSLDEIMSANLLIKKTVANLYNRETAEKMLILYGGSVNSKNAFDFVDKTGMDGLLIGGASLNASEFVRIVKLFG